MALDPSFKTPGWYAQVDASQNISSATGEPRLIFGQKTAAGAATADTPVLVTSESSAITLFGQGSQAHLMCKRALANNRTIPLYVIPLDDDGAATQATGTITVSVTTAEAGTIALYVAGQKVSVAVADGDADTAIASAIETAINANNDLPLTASAALAVVTLTAKNAGTVGNELDLRENYFGLAGGESTPVGVSLAIVAMAGGATDPSLTNAIASMGDTGYDYIAFPYTSATELNAIGAELDDTDAGRWGKLRQVYGHAFACKVDSLSNLAIFGATRNDQHVSVLGLASCPSPSFEVAAALMSVAAGSLSARPANPISKAAFAGILGPSQTDRFTATERNTLLNNGLASALVSTTGQVSVDLCATTYQQDALGNDDDAYFQVQTLATNQALLRVWKQRSAKYAEYSLVSDDKRLRAGVSKVTTAKKVVGDVLIGGYREGIRNGWVEDMDGFVERLNWSLQGSRIVVSELPADLANPLRQWDVTLAFQLDFS